MPIVALEVAAVTAHHAARKPAASADREGSTPFADMLDTPDSIDQSAPKNLDQSKDQGLSAQAAPGVDGTEPATPADAKAAVSPDVATAEIPAIETQAVDPAVASDAPATEQEIADFLATVAAATGMKITPVAQSKAGEKPAETKPDDQSDDAPVVIADAAAPIETKAADAAAIAVPVQADTTASAPEAAEAAAPALPKSAGIVAATAERPDAPITATGDAIVPTETKDAKPKVAAKTDTPALAPNLAPNLASDTTAPEAGKPVTNPQAAQPQAQKPEAPAQAAKPAPAQHDARAPDIAAAVKPADNLQPMVMVANQTPAAPAANQTALTPAPATTPQAVTLPVAGIAIEIAGRALDGKKSFDIRLDPPELGKIHVRLDVDHKGEVSSIITADRSDTFDLLRRDAQSLERALQDAGVKTSSNGLQFSLRDQGAGRQDQPALADSARVIVRDDNLNTEIIAPVYRSFSGNRAGVDIRV